MSDAENSPLPEKHMMSPSRQSQGWGNDTTQNSDTFLLDDTGDDQDHYEMRRISIADTHL